MPRTFSDNWYRVADLRLGLRPGVSIRLHDYRGEPWYVLRERAHGRYFRINPVTYSFVSRLSVEITLDEVWRAAIQMAPEETPGQEAIFDLVVALYKANLIYVEGGVDESKIMERFSQKKKKPVLARISELLFLKIPLWDPDAWLNRNRRVIDFLFGRAMRWLVGILVLWAGIEFLMAGSRAWQQAGTILQLDNLFLLYVAVFFSHVLHELAHAALCKRFGGEVRTMGVMLLMLTPLPYVDLSSSWTFRDRFQRALVDAAGMLSDLVLGAVATLIWAYSPAGMVNELAYNLMFSTAIYTVIFNINPLMRFDGYYILSDLIEIPNLHEQAKNQFSRWWGQRVLGIAINDDEATSARRQSLLLAFFVTSNIYRLMVMFGIVLFVADQYFGIGLMVAVALGLTSFVLPINKMLAPLKNPLFIYQQKQFLQRAGVALLVLLALFVGLPMPYSRTLDGVVEAGLNTPVFTESGGLVQAVAATSGKWVKTGDVLVVLENPELIAELAGMQAQLRQASTQEAKAVTEGGVDLAPLRERLASLGVSQASLEKQRLALEVRAPHEGIWVDSETRQKNQSWVARGAELGRVVDDRTHIFLGVIKQEAGTALIGVATRGSKVRVEGERDALHSVAAISLVPHSQSTLPSAALGPTAGGAIPVTTADRSGRQAAESFFLLRAELQKDATRQFDDAVRHGRAGWIKIPLPALPLAVQAWRASSQYFLRRYGL